MGSLVQSAPLVVGEKGASRRKPIWNSLHTFMLATSGSLVGVCAIGIWLTSDSDWKSWAITGCVFLPISLLPGLFWNERSQYERRDAALVLPWIFLLTMLVPCLVVVSAKMAFPPRDQLFAQMDQAIGFSVPRLMAWASAHRIINGLLGASYSLLAFFQLSAMIVPALTGRRKAAERFLIAGTVSFAAALPVFMLLPAFGPWAGYHFAASTPQRINEAAMTAWRGGGHPAAVGIVVFPSFHVIWAVLSAAALWFIKPLRWPVCLLAALIVISTVTTGWHYVVDALAGLLFAGLSLLCADAILRRLGRFAS